MSKGRSERVYLPGGATVPLRYRGLQCGRRGRHGPSDEDVAANQRYRLCGAMVQLTAEHGYGNLTVRKLCERAHVSRRDLYRHFKGGLHECFLAAFAQIAHSVLCRLDRAQREADDALDRLRLAVLELVRAVYDEPAAGRLLLVEPFAVGSCAVQCMNTEWQGFEALLGESVHDISGLQPVHSSLIAKGVVAGIAGAVGVRLLEGRAHELRVLGEPLADWAQCCAQFPAFDSGTGGVCLPYKPSHLLLEAARRGDDERARILAATGRLVVRHGYSGLCERRIREAAGVTGKQFQGHFADEREAFMAVLELLWAAAMRHAALEGKKAGEWTQGLIRSVYALTACLAADPTFAQLAFIEVVAAGARSLRSREVPIGTVTRRLVADAPSGGCPNPIAAEATAGAAWAIIHRHIAADGGERLSNVAPMLAFFALAPLIGAQAATEAIQASSQGESRPAQVRR